ncbi:hypothetical protein ACFOD4_05440 [Pseudoroseomonas globiformis]|uniref:Amino acid transporter n=1 Tax=Teichococcus globiformis TaxID=2307229 RepID=A0ABV7FVU3_9PROT
MPADDPPVQAPPGNLSAGNLVHNERLKLTAGWLNTLASASVVAGGISPLVAILYGFSQPHQAGWLVALVSLVWILGGIALHWMARSLLKGLRP